MTNLDFDKPKGKVKIPNLVISLVMIGAIVILAKNLLSAQKTIPKSTQTYQNLPSPKPLEPTATPEPATQTIEPTTSPMTVEYDSSLGNNYVASKYAQSIFKISDKASQGVISNLRVELSPEVVGDKNEDDYKNSVTSSFLSAQVSNSFWNSLDDGTKKDFVASFVVALGNIFPHSYPHVALFSSVRKVATGEYNTFKTEPRIKLY